MEREESMGERREVEKRGGEEGEGRIKSSAGRQQQQRQQRGSSAAKAEVATKLPCTHMPHATCSMHSQLAVNPPLPPPQLPSALLINCCIYVSGLRCDNLRQSCCAAGSSANRSAKEHVEQ